MEELLSQLQSLVRGGWKYRWYAVTIAWVVSTIGFVVVYKLPDNFQASARVFVDTQSILKPLLSGMTSVPNVEQQVSIMSRTLLSRPNVERVMRMVDLDIRANTGKDRERMIDDLIAKIKIGGTAQNDIYSLAFSDENPKLAKDVVQALLTIFVEGSFGDKKQDSNKAVVFIDGQIKIYEEKLVAAENALKDFKLKNMNILPRQGSDSSSKLSEMTDSLSQARLELSEAVQARDAIRREISNAESALRPSNPVLAPNPEIDDRILALNKNLDSLRLQFTDQHPDILSTKRLIAQLEARKAEEAKVRKPSSEITTSNPLFQQLKISLSVAEARVASMHARTDEYARRIARLQVLSNAAPEIETQLSQLNRDYQINKENYEKLVASRESAKLSGDLNTTTEMMTFRVIDPPSVPLTPAGPPRLRLFSLVFAAALAIGLAGSVLMSKIRPTFLSHIDLLEATGLPILGTISMKWTSAEQARQRKSLYAFGLSTFVLLTFYAALMGFIYFKS
ncbi:XrtA system polysaccharide chain length determinant [Undibacterium sp.]|uniref:XrtA system polysaccharide chain length determinant n=1 Tax=Undibacterium sp. TaxID=1914977 RepID=UPI0025CEF3A6|nr:XrtA system polysaccharide chain length determinant [Undibacterium sp.]MCX7217600.1 chain length-determining protein [Burkholderiales bacterium]